MHRGELDGAKIRRAFFWSRIGLAQETRDGSVSSWLCEALVTDLGTSIGLMSNTTPGLRSETASPTGFDSQNRVSHQTCEYVQVEALVNGQ